jgi:phage terminase large subunit-like protein
MNYEAELTAFPVAKHDDQVDSTSQFLKWIQGRGTTESYEETLKKLGVI